MNRPKFSERSYYVFGDQTTFITQNGTQGGVSLFTVDEEQEDDFDSVSEYDRDSNNYAPMSFPPPPLPQSTASMPPMSMGMPPTVASNQAPGLPFGGQPNNMNYHHHHHHHHNHHAGGKIYSNVGIGGPSSLEPHSHGTAGSGNNNNNYHSSSSSNVTSNSTSTTSQNTTTASSATAIGM